MGDVLFEPLVFRNLTLKNRILRSSISGRIDNYDGSGAPARIAWEERFAAGGVGALISAHVPVHVRGRILPNYAFIDADDKIPFWRELVDRVHAHDCKFILQLSHSGRQQDIGGVENEGLVPLSATNKADGFHGFAAHAMDPREIDEVVGQFADGAVRAREAGCDGVELHAANGYLFTQFLSSAINDRTDGYGGSLWNRTRFLREVVAAVRKAAGADFHLQVKFSAVDHNSAVLFWEDDGNTLEDGVDIAGWMEDAGVDALHVSTGSLFPHPMNPAGTLPTEVLAHSYDTMLSSGRHTLRNYFLFRFFGPLFRSYWESKRVSELEGFLLGDSRAVRARVKIPVMVTGGFQTASLIRDAIDRGDCDAVTMARPLLANPDLPKLFAAGKDRADRPCTYCNECLLRVLEDPLGCYDVSRFEGDREAMLRSVMAFYGDAAYPPGPGRPR